jgi:hypothetical protein
MVLSDEQLKIGNEIANVIQKNRPNIKLSSLKQYVGTLRKLVERTGIKLEDINSDPDGTIEKVKEVANEYRYNTLKNVFISLIVFSNNEQAKQKYEPHLNKYNEKYYEEMAKGNYAPTQKDKQDITLEQVKEVLKIYRNKANEILSKKPKQITAEQHDDLTNYLILELYIGDDPCCVRNDYRDVMLSDSTGTKKALSDKNNNYYMYKTGTFVINRHKTDGIEPLIFTVGKELKDFIKKYISFSKGIPYLIYNNNIEPYSTSAFSNRLVRLFKEHLGVNIGSTMLRHIVLTDKFHDTKEEMKKMAKKMAHSVHTQQLIYTK